MIPAGQYFNGSPDPQFGKFERFEAIPNDPDALKWLLREEHRNREQLPPGDFKAHIAALHDGLIETEARRIVREMKRHDTPNSPNKTIYAVTYKLENEGKISQYSKLVGKRRTRVYYHLEPEGKEYYTQLLNNFRDAYTGVEKYFHL